MTAQVGDRLVIHAHRVAEPARAVKAVHRCGDDHATIIDPASDACVRH